MSGHPIAALPAAAKPMAQFLLNPEGLSGRMIVAIFGLAFWQPAAYQRILGQRSSMKAPPVSAELSPDQRVTSFRSRALMWSIPLATAAIAAAIFVIDAFIKFDIAIAVLYVTVVLTSVSFFNRRGVLAVAVSCAALTVLAFSIQHWHDAKFESISRCLVSLLAIGITTALAVRIQSTTATLQSQAQLLDLSRDAIFVRDMDDIITYWNRGAEELYGWTAQEAVGQVSRKLVQAGLPSYEEAMTELLRDGHWRSELIHRRKDGTAVTVASRWTLERDQRGEPVTILETNTDIEERRQAQDKLAKAQAELAHVSRVSTLGELAASIAHEVNQPLAAIVTSGEAALRWLNRDVPQIDGMKRSIERIISDGRRASEVVRRIRSLSRKAESQSLPVSLNEIVDDVRLLIQREVSVRRIILQLDLADPSPVVLGDRIQLQQVIMNLIMNAVQAMDLVPDHRELLVRTLLQDGGEAHIVVRDTGPGFESGNENALFDAFFTTKSDGMGMGLSICRSIVEAHGGRVWASRNAGRGATFQFALPVHQGTSS